MHMCNRQSSAHECRRTAALTSHHRLPCLGMTQHRPASHGHGGPLGRAFDPLTYLLSVAFGMTGNSSSESSSSSSLSSLAVSFCIAAPAVARRGREDTAETFVGTLRTSCNSLSSLLSASESAAAFFLGMVMVVDVGLAGGGQSSRPSPPWVWAHVGPSAAELFSEHSARPAAAICLGCRVYMLKRCEAHDLQHKSRARVSCAQQKLVLT